VPDPHLRIANAFAPPETTAAAHFVVRLVEGKPVHFVPGRPLVISDEEEQRPLKIA
jgi:hypothetical protein